MGKTEAKGIQERIWHCKVLLNSIEPQQLSDIGLSYLQCLSRLVYGESWGVVK